MKVHFSLVLILFTLSVMAKEQEVSVLLSEFRTTLLEARNLPVGEKTNYKCPKWQWMLIGKPSSMLLDTLPEADYKDGRVLSYFLTSPTPPGQRGGGFPEVTFNLGKGGKIESISCNRSK